MLLSQHTPKLLLIVKPYRNSNPGKYLQELLIDKPKKIISELSPKINYHQAYS